MSVRARFVRGSAAFALPLAFLVSSVWGQFEATGLVQPEFEAILSSTVLGRVESVEVKEGYRVNAGDVLIQLEKSVETLDANRRQVVAESTVEIDIARKKVAVMEEAFEGTRKVYEGSGSISKEDFDKSRLEMELAKAELAQLEQREKIEALELSLAKEQVERRIIRAPQAGVVVDVLPEVGEVCEPRQPLARIVDVTTVRINLDVDALRTAGVVEGMQVSVTADSPAGPVAATGVVDFVSPVVDGASGLRRIRVSIDNRDEAILPGLPATVSFPLGN